MSHLGIWQKTLSQRVLIGFVSMLALFAYQPPASAQVDQWGAWKNGVTEHWWLSSETFTSEEAGKAIERWDAIGSTEVDENGRQWEGDYFVGSETHGTYLRWSASAGFVIANVNKCQALVMGVTYGKVEVTPTLIRFVPEFGKSSKSHGVAHELHPAVLMSFIPVKWRQQLLLINETEIKDFADHVAGLGDFNALNDGFFDETSSHFFSKYAGAQAIRVETPSLPDRFEAFIRKPIETTITSVLGRRVERNYSYEVSSKLRSSTVQYDLASISLVRIGAGKTNGLKKDHLLRVTNPDLGEIVRVIDVGQTSSRAVLVRKLSKQHQELHYDNDVQREVLYPRVEVGWKLTTAPRR